MAEEVKYYGVFKTLTPIEEYGQGNQKRFFVISTVEQYPKTVAFELNGQKINLGDQFKPGESVAVSYNLGGREWVNPQGETKYFNTVQAWKIAHVTDGVKTEQPAQTQPAPQQAAPPAQQTQPQTDAFQDESANDDVLF